MFEYYKITSRGMAKVRKLKLTRGWPMADEERQPLRYLAKMPHIPRNFEQLYKQVSFLVPRKLLQKGIDKLIKKGFVVKVS